MKKEIKWGNIPIPGIDENELDKYTTQYLGCIEGGKRGGETNKNSGHISKLGKQFGKQNANHPNSLAATSKMGKKYGPENAKKIPIEKKIEGAKKAGKKRIQMEDWKDMPSIGGKVSAVNRVNRMLEKYKQILDLIPNKQFTTSEAKLACNQFGYDNWKKFLKETRLVKQIYKGPNQFNPSIYEKIS